VRGGGGDQTLSVLVEHCRLARGAVDS
jgi:hypothetical protein